MKNNILLIFILVTFFSSCKKNDIEFCDRYVEGEVIIGTKEDVKFEDALLLINMNFLDIISCFGPLYESSFPADSLEYVISVLKSKPYMNKNGWAGGAYLHYQTNKIICINQMMDLDIASQQDWHRTVQQLKLCQKDNVTSFLLNVKNGKEKRWVRYFKSNFIIKWAELNCYIDFGPL